MIFGTEDDDLRARRFRALGWAFEECPTQTQRHPEDQENMEDG
jgi:hypothetical protein